MPEIIIPRNSRHNKSYTPLMPKTLRIPGLSGQWFFAHPDTGELQPVERIYVMTPAGFGSFYRAGPFEDGLVALEFAPEPPAPAVMKQIEESLQ